MKTKIKLLVGKVIDGSVFPAESVVEVESGVAKLWIDAKDATPALPPSALAVTSPKAGKDISVFEEEDK